MIMEFMGKPVVPRRQRRHIGAGQSQNEPDEYAPIRIMAMSGRRQDSPAPRYSSFSGSADSKNA